MMAGMIATLRRHDTVLADGRFGLDMSVSTIYIEWRRLTTLEINVRVVSEACLILRTIYAPSCLPTIPSPSSIKTQECLFASRRQSRPVKNIDNQPHKYTNEIHERWVVLVAEYVSVSMCSICDRAGRAAENSCNTEAVATTPLHLRMVLHHEFRRRGITQENSFHPGSSPSCSPRRISNSSGSQRGHSTRSAQLGAASSAFAVRLITIPMTNRSRGAIIRVPDFLCIGF